MNFEGHNSTCNKQEGRSLVMTKAGFSAWLCKNAVGDEILTDS